MNNLITNLWQRFQFSIALRTGNIQLAKTLLESKQKAGLKLSILEKIFRDKLNLESRLNQNQKEILYLRQQFTQATHNLAEVYTSNQQLEQDLNQLNSKYIVNQQEITALHNQLKLQTKQIDKLIIQQEKEQRDRRIAESQESQRHPAFIETQSIKQQLLTPDPAIIDYISKSIKIVEVDAYKLQCTGIEPQVFDKFEASLAAYLQAEFHKIPTRDLQVKLQNAQADINCLKKQQDPLYSFDLTPHAYFLQYFLENVYCNYIAWFLMYKCGIIPQKLNILDIAAGPGTVAYGLALFLQSSSNIVSLPQMHISYYSLEKQPAFQHQGLQFWQKYIETQQPANNTYFKFDTSDILAEVNPQNLPQSFFDFAVVSHCFFDNLEQRKQSIKAYKQIFSDNLTPSGYILLIVQGAKLFRTYKVSISEDQSKEERVINQLVNELDLNLVWYKYLTSTGKRTYMEAFGEFARKNLPKQQFINQLKRDLKINYDCHYSLDDYIILARK